MTDTAARFDLDPYAHDANHWGVSLAQNADVMLPCLDAAGARSVVEVGAYAGDFTRVLAAWAAETGATVGAIDPMPQPALEALADEHAGVQLVRETSLTALGHIELPDAVVIDGDHNWWTVTEELRLLSERAPGADLPLLLFHDVCWPHARRDDYHAASSLPADARHETIGDRGGIVPADDGFVAGGGLPYPNSAAHAGGARNGVRTAVEDWAATRPDVRFAVVPAFFGLGIAWSTQAPWSDAVAAVVDAFDDHPLLHRLEANRVHQLAAQQTRQQEIWALQERLARQEAVLRRLLDSSAFAVAERLSVVRARAGVATDASVVSKRQIREALGESQVDDRAAFWRALRSRHPGLRAAVAADARATAAHRGERHEFRSTADALAQALRLAVVSDAFAAQALYRVKAALQRRGVPLAPRVAHRLAMALAQVSIGDPVLVHPGVYIVHGQVVVDGLAEIGPGVTIAPWVTIGLRAGDVRAATIEADVSIGTGAKVIGPVTIGAGARVGANAVVVDDVAPGATVVGAPARPVGRG